MVNILSTWSATGAMYLIGLAMLVEAATGVSKPDIIAGISKEKSKCLLPVPDDPVSRVAEKTVLEKDDWLAMRTAKIRVENPVDS